MQFGKTLYLFAIGLLLSLGASAQNISIATGGTGGVYYPMGGGIAAVLSKYVPGMHVTVGEPRWPSMVARDSVRTAAS